jgi:exodeoxyribonuclease V beta subunit
LRDRIYKRLAKARNAFAGSPVTDDELLSHLTAHYPSRSQADRLLRQALMDFDRAAIFTIHGFCQRILYENAFETGSAFNAELLQDQTPMLTEAVEDFWRQRICDQPPEFLRFARRTLSDPGALLELARKSTTAEFAVTPRQDRPCLQAETLAVFRRRLDRLKSDWQGARDDVRRILAEAALNGRSYGTLKPGERGGPSQRERMVQRLIEAMDGFVSHAGPEYPLVEAVEKLASSTLARLTLRGGRAPLHPVFDWCEALLQTGRSLGLEMTAHLHYLKGSLLEFVRCELERRKAEKGLVSFDDLLRRVAQALDARGGHELADSVRRRYQAALVDEFQDTDELQYVVFMRLFSSLPHLLFMIGDPKQAIYGFRGADIFSYLRAARQASARFTLIRNWRSSPGLVQAINALLARSPAPFLFSGIDFIPGKSARSGEAPTPAPMVIWHVDSRRHRDDGSALAKGQAQVLIARAVTAEIQRLTSSGRAAARAGDIAVLVRTNKQAELMKAHLSTAGVPSVIYSTANVFDSTEAKELIALLASIAEPQNPARLKSALATRLLGVTAGEIATGDRARDAWDQSIQRHWGYSRLWSEKGFTTMFRQLLAGEAVKQRLLALPDGERRLTNLLHLAELLHRAAAGENLGPSGLVKWLSRQVNSPTQRSEETQLRLESDELAVKIVTIHRSKGLEYPVVFCPFAWSGSGLRDENFFFHDLERANRLTADLSGEPDSPNRVRAENELLAENLRVLYVSLTRARERCYLAWGRINTAETSALAYLFRTAQPSDPDPAGGDWIERLKVEYKAIGEDELRSRLDDLAAASGGTIAVEPMPEVLIARGTEAYRSAGPLTCREFHVRIDHSWSLTSYSALASAAAADTPDRDAAPALKAGPASEEISRPSSEAGILGFPAGARAGTFFHSLFETLDFAIRDFRPVVAAKLKEFGFDVSWAEPVCTMIAEVLAAPLFGSEPAVRLADVDRDRRLTEMEFYFPLKLVSPAILEDVFSRHGSKTGAGGAWASEEVERLQFAPTRGFMKGFIDLAFEHRGRYYLVDWKSNRVGAALEDYHRDRLSGVMREHLYRLQYHIYTLALHQYLRLRVPGYDYARDFGGVCYIFLRGVTSAGGPQCGLFVDRPAPSLVHALGETLIPGYA